MGNDTTKEASTESMAGFMAGMLISSIIHFIPMISAIGVFYTVLVELLIWWIAYYAYKYQQVKNDA